MQRVSAGATKGWGWKGRTDLKNVVILEPLCERDLLGDRECVGEVFVRQFVQFHGVVCFFVVSSQGQPCGCFGGVFTFGNDERMAFGEWADVEKGESRTGER